ncbi:MAG: hypothetical protein QXM96_00255 [Candidatus Woesearchaeota archaeon]
MMEEKNKKNIEAEFYEFNNEDVNDDIHLFLDDEDVLINEIDFSNISGNNLDEVISEIRGAIKGKKQELKYNPKKLSKKIKKTKKGTVLSQKKFGKVTKVYVPRDRKVIIQGVSKFILSNQADNIKNIGYFKGEKLRELVLIVNNDTPNSFNFELFNPSSPLDYFMSTSLDINSKIQVASGQGISYSELLHYSLANPIFIPNAKFVISGNFVQQRAIPLKFINKNIEGKVFSEPLNLDNFIDSYQNLSDIVYFDIYNTLNRCFCPDGVDIIEYTVLPFTYVAMCFYFKQYQLKRLLFNECLNDKKLLK